MPSQPKNDISKVLKAYVSKTISGLAGKYSRTLILQYLNYAILSAIHGYPIQMPNNTRVEFHRFSTGEKAKVKGKIFTSRLNSDFYFILSITSRHITKFNYVFYPNKETSKLIQDFIDSDKIYQLVRS